jgi:hypothetical protein
LSLSDQLVRARRSVLTGIRELEAFVKATQRGFVGELKLAQGIQEKLKIGLKGGEEPPPPTATADDKLKRIELTEDEVRALLDVVARARARITERYPGMLLNMALIYLAALFDAFMSDSLASILAARPDMLRSSKQLTYESALSFDDRDAMVEFMAQREIGEMGYKSFKDQLSYYKTRVGVVLDGAAVDAAQFVELTARRTVLVHNNGAANQIYVTLVGDTSVRLGDRLDVDDVNWANSVEVVTRAVTAISEQLEAKFASPASPRE